MARAYLKKRRAVIVRSAERAVNQEQSRILLNPGLGDRHASAALAMTKGLASQNNSEDRSTSGVLCE
jgi:hypothetical protein